MSQISHKPASRIFTRAAVMACALACVLAAGGLARAGDDEDEAPDVKFLRNMLHGIGLQDGSEDRIEYRERSPLVLPTSRDLPPPAAEAQPNVSNWPVDQDVQKRKAERAAKKKEQKAGSSSDAVREAASPLPPDKLGPGPSASAKRTTGYSDSPSAETNMPGRKLSASELGYTGGFFSSLWGGKSDETVKFTQEPRRESLTDPPVGYRTPSFAQPYGVLSNSGKPSVGAVTTAPREGGAERKD